MVPPLLNINPSQLEFLFEADKELKSALNIRNLNDVTRAAFKIKTSNLERFAVSPPFGIVEPGSTKLVKVYLRAVSSYTDDLRFCKDCFLIQSIVVDDDMTVEDITSDLFKSQQRQEARMKVFVAAPLAHGKILEHEIKDIAQNQGVEGHRAVARKFAELLLAKGIISQAQVALAFSTVGELFQDLQDLPKAVENAGEQFRKSNSQIFLEGRTGLMTELTPSSSGVGLSEWTNLPQSRRYDISKAATFRSVQPLNGIDSPSRSPPSMQTRANGDSIISALTPGTEHMASPLMRRTPDLRSSFSAPHTRSRLSVDDKAEVYDRGDLSDPAVQRNLSYDDVAVNKAFPDDMYSQQLADGLPDYASNPVSSQSSPMARERQSEFRPSLDDDLTPTKSGSGQDVNPLFSIPSPRLGNENTIPSHRPVDSRNVFASALYGSPATSADQNQPRSPSGLSRQAGRQHDQALNVMPAPLLPVDDPAVGNSLDDSYAGSGPREANIAEADGFADGARLANGMAAVGNQHELGQPMGNTGDLAGAPKRKLTSPISTHRSSSASEGSQDADGPRRAASKGVRSAADSMGRTNVVTSIDRLATPAIRKPALPSGIRQDGITSPQRRHLDFSAQSSPPAKVVSPESSTGDKGHVTDPPDFSNLHLDIRDTDAARDSGDSISPSAQDVKIPSGNTLQMAKLWDARTALA